MKILYPSSEITPSYGGIGAYVYKTIKELITNYKDFEAVIVTSNQHQDDSFSTYFDGVDRVKVISLFEQKYNHIVIRDLRFQLNLARKIKKVIKDEEIDIVHHQTGHYDLFFSINFLDNIPIILTSHGDLLTLLEKWKNARLRNFDEKINYYTGTLLYQEEKILYKKSDKIITIADHVKTQLIKHYKINPEKIHTIYNYVNPDTFYFHPGEFREPYKIGFIGRPYYIKGFYDLITLLNRHANNNTFEWHLVTNSELVKKLVTNNKNIYCYNTISQAKLSEFYDTIDCMVIPSYSEACPTVAIESLLKGKILITREIIGIQEIMKNCFRYSFNDIAQVQLNDILKTVLHDNQTLLELLKQNRDTIKKQYGSINITNDIYELYKKYS